MACASLLLPVAASLQAPHDAGLLVARHWVGGPSAESTPLPLLLVARTE